MACSSSSAAASSSSDDALNRQLDEMEAEIRGTVDTLSRIEEFMQPSEQPDNKGLAINM